MTKNTTVSVIKADVGSCPGHVRPEKGMIELFEKHIESEGLKKGLIEDFRVYNCGDDIGVVMSHFRGKDDEKIHHLAWDGFVKAADYAKKLKLYGAGQDLLKDAFSGNVKGMGPGVAEMEFVERKSDPVLVFACDKTDPAAFSLPLYKAFADPFNTAGLVIDPKGAVGFSFDVMNIYENTVVRMKCPEEIYSMLALIGSTGKYAVKNVFINGNLPETESICATVCTEKLSLIAGQYVGKDDPVAICRAQSGFPAVGEILEAFALGHTVAGWMRGSHRGPLMPVSFEDATPTRFDGPPRIIGLGFQVGNGKLVGPVDLFKDPSFNITRERCMKVAEYLRAHGPFEPHRLGEDEMEYTTLPKVLEKLKPRMKKLV